MSEKKIALNLFQVKKWYKNTRLYLRKTLTFILKRIIKPDLMLRLDLRK